MLLGLIIGACIGVLAMGLCAMGGRDSAFDEGRSEGYDRGYKCGHKEASQAADDNYHAGFTRGLAMVDARANTSFNNGFKEGREEGFQEGHEEGFGDAVEHFGFVEVDFDIGPDLTTARYDSRYSSQLKLIETRDAINKTLADKIKVS